MDQTALLLLSICCPKDSFGASHFVHRSVILIIIFEKSFVLVRSSYVSEVTKDAQRHLGALPHSSNMMTIQLCSASSTMLGRITNRSSE
jgi:hypothetical protein